MVQIMSSLRHQLRRGRTNSTNNSNSPSLPVVAFLSWCTNRGHIRSLRSLQLNRRTVLPTLTHHFPHGLQRLSFPFTEAICQYQADLERIVWPLIRSKI